MKANPFVYRPRFAIAGGILLLLSLFALFHQQSFHHESHGKYNIDRSDMNLHGVILNIPLHKNVKKTVCPLRIDVGEWGVMISLKPGNITELLLIGGGNIVLQHKCKVIDHGNFSALTLSLHNGMILLDDATGTSSFPARNFSLAHPLKISGICTIDITGSYKMSLSIGLILLALAVICGITALSPPLAHHRPVNRKLLVLGGGCIIGLALAFLICYIHILTGSDYYPYNSFFFRELVIADDLFQAILPVRYTFLPYAWIGAGNYFPFTYIFLYLLPLHNFYAVVAILYGLFALVTAVSAFRMVRPRDWKESALLLFLTWGTLPTLLLWRSGNLEMLVLVFILLFFYFFRRFPAISSFLLAFLINIKLYPGILGIMFLKKKMFKAAILCFFFSLAMLLIALSSLKWNISNFMHCMKFFSYTYSVYINDGLIFSHSLFSLYRYIGAHFFDLTSENICNFMPYYSAFCLIFFIFTMIMILIKKFSRWETCFLLIGMAIFLPPISFDYTLVLLLPALWLFIRERRQIKYLWVHIVCWVLLFIPENWHHSPLAAELQISVAIKPVALLIMILLIIIGRLRSPENEKNSLQKSSITGQ